MKAILPILLFTFLQAHCLSQPLPEKMIIADAIGINKGLSQGMVNCILQDHYGFMWFGTMDGLNRYDGYRFQVFRNDLFDNKTISGNFITSIFEDSKGRLWIGTALNGLNLFIWEKEQFIHYNNNSNPALSNNTIFSIQEDLNGAIWIGTASGLNKLTVQDHPGKNKGALSDSQQMDNTPFHLSIKPIYLVDAGGNEIFKINKYSEPVFLITKSGTIWVSASNTIFKIVTPAPDNEVIVKEDISTYSARQKNGSYGDIIKIMEDTTKKLLCFKGKNFFTVIDEKNGQSSSWDCAPLDLDMGRNQTVFDKGILWERALYGLLYFDLLNKKILRVRSYDSENDKILETPFSIYKDRSGIIWIGTGGYNR